MAIGGPDSVDCEALQQFADNTGGPVIRANEQAIDEGPAEAEEVLNNGSVQDGDVVDYDDAQNILIRSESPFTSALKLAPAAGRWRALITGAMGFEPIDVRYRAMVENRSIIVAGGCTPSVDIDAPVALWCSATFRDRLSGLPVSAVITGPDDARHPIDLSDGLTGEPNAGTYRGLFIPGIPGSDCCRIRIVSRGDAIRSGVLHRMLHADPNIELCDEWLAADAPAFVRTVSGFFDVGKWPELRDLDDRNKGPSQHPGPLRKPHKLTPIIRPATEKGSGQ